MKTIHVLILAAAILGAAWILKPAPVVQISQAELERREKLDRWFQDQLAEEKVKKCAAAVGKTVETLDRNDPKQEAAYRKCMWPEESRGPIRKLWDKILRNLFSSDEHDSFYVARSPNYAVHRTGARVARSGRWPRAFGDPRTDPVVDAIGAESLRPSGGVGPEGEP